MGEISCAAIRTGYWLFTKHLITPITKISGPKNEFLKFTSTCTSTIITSTIQTSCKKPHNFSLTEGRGFEPLIRHFDRMAA